MLNSPKTPNVQYAPIRELSHMLTMMGWGMFKTKVEGVPLHNVNTAAKRVAYMLASLPP